MRASELCYGYACRVLLPFERNPATNDLSDHKPNLSAFLLFHHIRESNGTCHPHRFIQARPPGPLLRCCRNCCGRHEAWTNLGPHRLEEEKTKKARSVTRRFNHATRFRGERSNRRTPDMGMRVICVRGYPSVGRLRSERETSRPGRHRWWRLYSFIIFLPYEFLQNKTPLIWHDPCSSCVGDRMIPFG